MEAGGKALVMLDNTLRLGREEPAPENAELAGSWPPGASP